MKEFYTLNLDTNNYVLSIAHTANDNIELDLSNIYPSYLNAYQYLDGKLVLDEIKKQVIIAEQTKKSTEQQILTLKQELSQYDYIGTKLAMGVATKEDYADKIAHTEEIRKQIRILEGEVR